MLSHVLLRLLPFAGLGASQFSLYPAFVDPVKLSKAYGVTTECIQGLNQTLPECDQDLFSMVVNYDMFWWEQDNVTDLCLGNCSVAAALWYNNVMSACDGQWLNSYGKWIPADSVAGRYVDGINTVCLASSLGENTTWCLVESQNWVGSDVYQVDCIANPSDPSCAGNGTGINPADQRMANLYSNDVLCDDCFVQMLYTKVTSEFLADTDHADYLVDQLQDIADVCNTSIPAITTRASTTFDLAPAPTPTNATTTTPPSTITTCAPGQGQTLSSGSGCDSLSQKYGITTGDLKAISGNDGCSISRPSCYPSACSLQQVPSSATCDTMASSLNVTIVQFQSWNPNIIGLCDALLAGQYICKSPPGVTGTYTLAPPPLGTDADAGNQQRGGSGGIVTPTTTIPPGPTTPVPAPGPTLSGVSKMCNAWQTPAQGLGCVDFALLNSLSSEKLYQWNPILGPNGENCTTMFQFKVYYCVGVVIVGSGGAGTTTPPSSPIITSAPGPTQSGIVSSCNKYALPVNGQGCYDFATANNILPSQLYSWNAVLGPNGENCGTQFQAGEYYCVGIQQPSSTKPISAPGPTQSGIASSCTKFAQPPTGTGCYDFATQNGITPAQLYQWNTVLGPNGENCGTNFFAEDYYCVAA